MSSPSSSCPESCSFPHSVRVSRRAKRISLRVRPGAGLEVVLPPHADPACVPDLLLRHRDWIKKTLRRLSDDEAAARAPQTGPPGAFLIKGGEELVRLVPVPRTGRGALWEASVPPPGCAPLDAPLLREGAQARALTRPPGERFLAVSEESAEGRKALLREWVRDEAARWLEPALAALAADLDLPYGRVSFRFQKSRWGSCSAKRNINLNACLLFLPEALARYILLHELCHLRQMNHGEGFWKLVFAVDPEALAKDRAMRSAWKYVPQWLGAVSQ